jgi:gas vesicle protein
MTMDARQPDDLRPVQQSDPIDSGAFVLGTLIGLAIGALAALWYAPVSGGRLRRTLTAAVERTSRAARTQAEAINQSLSADPIAQSVAEGKAAARRRRAALGMADPESR